MIRTKTWLIALATAALMTGSAHAQLKVGITMSASGPGAALGQPQSKTVAILPKEIAGQNSDRHFIMWEYDSLAAFEAYKKRRKDYPGPFAEYKKHDPYHMDVFDHASMEVEIWYDLERPLWLL